MYLFSDFGDSVKSFNFAFMRINCITLYKFRPVSATSSNFRVTAASER